MIESLPSISFHTGLSVRNIRTSLEKLKATREVTVKSTRYGSVINVIKWDFYQGQPSLTDTQSDTQTDREVTGKRHSNKKNKNIRRKEEREEASASFSPPSLSDIRSYISERNSNVIAERFFDYYEARNWQGISDWKALLRSWETNERPEPQQTAKPYRVKELPEYMKGHEDIYD